MPPNRLSRFLLILCCLCLGACSTVAYVGRAVSGHLQVMQSRQPVSEIIEDDRTDDRLRKKLVYIGAVLDFAHDELALPDNGSYRHYADLDRSYIAWNVFAAPPLSLEAKQWCYPLVGCFDYRGYFDRESAMDYAAQLREQDWEVYIGAVRAYSTLGWSRDPVLNTMLDQEDWEIARLIFHELAHQKIYIKNKVDINEAFAESIARIGLERWLESRDKDTTHIRRSLVFEDAFMNLVLDYKERLGELYNSDRPDTIKIRRKDQILGELRQDYQRLKLQHEGIDLFDRWMSVDLNNAKLAAIATYRQWMPEFLALYNATGKDLTRFYSYVEAMRHCPHDALRQRLREYSPGKSC